MTLGLSPLWLAASCAFLVLTSTAGLLAIRGSIMERVVAMQLASSLATLTLLVLAEAFNRDVYFDLAVVVALMSFAATLFYLRALEWWT